jgi:hypothetical protein
VVVPDFEGCPFAQYELATSEGRDAFLWTISELGKECVPRAASYLGARLVTEKYPSSTHAFSVLLDAFLTELDSFNEPLPNRESFGHPDEWHRAVSNHFGAVDAHISAAIGKYSLMLAATLLSCDRLNKSI